MSPEPIVTIAKITWSLGWVHQQDYPLNEGEQRAEDKQGVPTNEIVCWHVLRE